MQFLYRITEDGYYNHPSSRADFRGGFIGSRLSEAYNGYFGNSDEVKKFTNSCLSEEVVTSLTKNPKLLGIGSGSGIVEQSVKEGLLNTGYQPSLIISDYIDQALEHNQDPSTVKKSFDNKEIPFPDNTFDLVMARSVTHYEKNNEAELKVISEVYRVLKPGCFFVTQAPYFYTSQETVLMRSIHLLVGKFLNNHTDQEYRQMLLSQFPTVLISSEVLGSLKADEKGFFERYNILEQQQPELLEKVRALILEVPQALRPLIWASSNGFGWECFFKIYLARKTLS